MLIDDIPAMSLEILKRNVKDYDSLSDSEIVEYFKNTYNLADVPNLTDEDKALALIKDAIDNDKYIVVATDYDSDGLGSAAVAYKALKGKSNNYLVMHNKRSQGNGFNPTLVAELKRIHDRKPIDLLITADHGSSSEEGLSALKAYGVKRILITDHHEIPADNFPNSADVFINPQKQDGDPVGMSGCYVLFKVLSGLYKDDDDIYNNLYKDCLPHVALTTISDVMSLSIAYNRRVVRAGLQIMNGDTGLWKMLMDKLNVAGKFSYKDLGYVLSPFVNTGNRSGQENLFYKILIESDDDLRSDLIDQGIVFNLKRKDIKKKIMRNLSTSLDPGAVGKSLSLIVDTPMAINGIIASSLGEQHQVPVTCFIINKETGVLSGSARAILDHMDISDMFNRMAKMDSELFLGYGGHKGAGGCGILFDKLDTFKRLFEIVAADTPVPSVEVTPRLCIDVNTKYITYGIVDELNYAGPFGKDWEMPLFRGMFKVVSVLAFSTMAILKLVNASGVTVSGTYFYKPNDSLDSIVEEVPRGRVVRLLFEPQFYKRRTLLNYTILVDTIEEA